MRLEIVIDITEAAVIINRLKRRPRLKSAALAASTAYQEGIARNFDSESSGRGRWAPLKPRTVRERRRLGYPPTNPILYRSGSLKRGWVHPAAALFLGESVEIKNASKPEIAKYLAARGRPQHILKATDLRRVVEAAVTTSIRDVFGLGAS